VTAVRERLGSGYLAVDEGAEVRGRVIPPARDRARRERRRGRAVGSLVVLGQDVSIGPGSTVERSVIMNGAEIGAGCTLRDCIVAAGCRVGMTLGSPRSGARRGVTVGADNVIAHGARIFPGVTLPDGALRF